MILVCLFHAVQATYSDLWSAHSHSYRAVFLQLHLLVVAHALVDIIQAYCKRSISQQTATAAQRPAALLQHRRLARSTLHDARHWRAALRCRHDALQGYKGHGAQGVADDVVAPIF